MNILLTGATGLIGKKIGQLLVQQGHTVFVVTRNVEQAIQNAVFPVTPAEEYRARPRT